MRSCFGFSICAKMTYCVIRRNAYSPARRPLNVGDRPASPRGKAKKSDLAIVAGIRWCGVINSCARHRDANRRFMHGRHDLGFDATRAWHLPNASSGIREVVNRLAIRRLDGSQTAAGSDLYCLSTSGRHLPDLPLPGARAVEIYHPPVVRITRHRIIRRIGRELDRRSTRCGDYMNVALAMSSGMEYQPMPVRGPERGAYKRSFERCDSHRIGTGRSGDLDLRRAGSFGDESNVLAVR